ncbi:MAG: SMI1/KNR4 family protein [Cellulosilyticaceae bacterium]
MENEKIAKIILQYLNTGRFYGQVEEKYINKAEEQLQVSFPKSYKQFLRQYGSGGILGITISGVQSNDNSSVVSSTERYRKLGLDMKCVVVQDCGEFAMCLDTSEMVDNECPIVSWGRASKRKNERYKNFDNYLIDILNEAIDNWDEDIDEDE